jgi:hypothetical protein
MHIEVPYFYIPYSLFFISYFSCISDDRDLLSFKKIAYPFGVIVTTGIIISSSEIPPC